MAYFPVVLSVFLFFLAFNILILPLAYLKCLGIRIFQLSFETVAFPKNERVF